MPVGHRFTPLGTVNDGCVSLHEIVVRTVVDHAKVSGWFLPGADVTLDLVTFDPTRSQDDEEDNPPAQQHHEWKQAPLDETHVQRILSQQQQQQQVNWMVQRRIKFV